MRLNRLTLKDKKLFDKFLSLKRHELSTYAFTNIYIWKGLFEIYWILIADSLCIFFQDKIGCFLYLPPLGKKLQPEVIQETFSIMDSFNKNKDISRIENVSQKDLSFFRALGYAGKEKPGDYLCQRVDLVQLKGNRFKSKRASFNYFIKHYEFKYLPFSLKYRDACLKLYNLWMKERQTKNKDAIYQGMLKDSLTCLKVLLEDYVRLDIIGRIVKIDKEIKAFTFGFKLNKDTFCILYELADLSIKGLSQFIFREFCRELRNYRYINIMDDSGLANLKRVKLSYHPQSSIPNYIITRNHAQRYRRGRVYYF